MAQGKGFSKPLARQDQYTFRYVVSKASGEGEQTQVEIIANVGDLPGHVALAYNLVDTRMLQQNHRYLEFRTASMKLPPELRLAVNQCVDVAFGRATVADLERVKQDEAEMKESVDGKEGTEEASA